MLGKEALNMRNVLMFVGVAVLLTSVTACSNDTTTRRVTTTTTYEKPKPTEKTVIYTEPQASRETIILQPKQPDYTTESTYRVETHRVED